MRTRTVFVATLFALATFPLLAQQPPPTSQPNSPATQQDPPGAQPSPQNSPAASPETPAVEMSPVNGELVNKLDSRTAKAGDSVVVRTRAAVKTTDGTEIPKGSKLVGHVIAAQASGTGQNSQVALQFDHVELKGGQNVAVRSQIQSIAPPESVVSTSGSQAAGSSAPGTGVAPGGGSAGQGAPATASAGSGGPAPGTLVAQTGQIAIRTTSIPGVLVANNAPGQQDPRMAQASSILLGAKKDIQLEGGTQMVLGLSGAGGGMQ
jgi:hypothetical protein